MKCELRDKWVANLRSGAFKQGTGHLQVDLIDGPHYCCLGVLCVTAGLPLTLHEGGTELLPPEPYQSTRNPNLASINPEPFGLTYQEVERLWRMNDGSNTKVQSWTFYEIANWIEKNVECE